MTIPRTITPEVLQCAREYPVVTVIGPRQAGKTTLVKSIFPDKPYRSLEDPDVRAFAQEDPRSFLSAFPDGVILDEFQRVPELLSYIQGIVDEDGRSGLFILTGSQNFLLMESVTQSLAGRTAIITLLPFSLEEIKNSYGEIELDDLLFRGFLPRIYDRNMDPFRVHRDYFQTYVERDLRTLLKVQDLQVFETFVRLCAGRVGQILNLSSLGNDCGVSQTTAKEWLHILESCFIVFRMQPWFANIGKRLTKSPKLYFHDVGLASYLCGAEEPRHLSTHPLKGNLFENLVVSELMKRRFNYGKDSKLHFFRDSNGHEVDALFPSGASMIPIEIKVGKTIAKDWFKQLKYFKELKGVEAETSLIIYGGSEDQKRSLGNITGLWTLEKVLTEEYGL